MPDIAALFDPTSVNTSMNFVVPGAQVGATIIFINESYVNIFIIAPDSSKFFLPANDRRMISLADANAQPNQVWHWQNQSQLNPANTINQVIAEIWYPWEKIVETYPNPIIRQANVGNSVTTSSVQTLSNEGGAANLLVIDVGDVTFSQLFTLFTDGHSTWAVDQAGVKHQVIKVQTSGNPLLLGQSGDITEVLGNAKVDGTLESVGAFTADAAATITGLLTATANTSSVVSSANKLNDVVNLPGGRLGGTSVGDILDAAGSHPQDVYIKVNGVTAPVFHIQCPAGTDVATFDKNGVITVTAIKLQVNQFRGINTGTVTVGAGGSVVVNHGLGATPIAILETADDPSNNQSASCDSYTSTQFTIRNFGAANSCIHRWWGYIQ